MRPNAQEKEKGSDVMMLTKYNFEAWLEDIEDRCLRKDKTDEKVKIAYLRQGLPITHKNQLRRALKQELAKAKELRKNYDDAEPAEKPYTWAIGYIRSEIVKKGLNDQKVTEAAELLKNDLSRLSITQFGFNLQKFHNRFHNIVERIETMGMTVPENLLTLYYQNACLPHRDLKHLTQDDEKRNAKTYTDLYTDYQLALSRHETSKEKSGAKHRGQNGKTMATKFRGK